SAAMVMPAIKTRSVTFGRFVSFFFQAEDGIRDFHVTGVQTCALPISGFVLANGSMSSNQSGEGEIRKNIIEADLVDCMVALPGQLFYSTQIPACLWFIARDRHNGKYRDRRGEVLFIDARKLGVMVSSTSRELTDAEIQRNART